MTNEPITIPQQTTPTPTAIARMFREPDENGFIRYRVYSNGDYVDLVWPRTRQQVLEALYKTCIDQVIEMLPGFDRHRVIEVVQSCLWQFDRWPDEPQFINWAIGKAQALCLLADFLTGTVFEEVEKIFRALPENTKEKSARVPPIQGSAREDKRPVRVKAETTEVSAVEFLMQICENPQELGPIVEGFPSPEAINTRLLDRAKKFVNDVRRDRREAPSFLVLDKLETKDGESMDPFSAMGIGSDAGGSPVPVHPAKLDPGRMWNGHPQLKRKPTWAQKIRPKGRQKPITVRQACDAWVELHWKEHKPITMAQLRKAGLKHGFGLKRIDSSLRRLGVTVEDEFIELPLAAAIESQRLQEAIPSELERIEAGNAWKPNLRVVQSAERLGNGYSLIPRLKST